MNKLFSLVNARPTYLKRELRDLITLNSLIPISVSLLTSATPSKSYPRQSAERKYERSEMGITYTKFSLPGNRRNLFVFRVLCQLASEPTNYQEAQVKK